MLNQLADWFDNRTGYRALLHEALEEPIPGGARWRYVFGSALSTTFIIQLATGPGDDPEVQVKFQRFRTQSEEKVPLA